MASKEFIQKRIEGKEKEIAKLEGKIARIRKVEAQNWQDPNPYYYTESDLKSALRDLESAKKALEDYKAQLQKENEKAGSRNVEVILQFLANWKGQVTQFYLDSLPKWVEARDAYYRADSAYCDEFNHGVWRHDGDKAKLNELKEVMKAAKSRWAEYNYLSRYIVGNCGEVHLNMELLAKDLEQEANMKYDFIIERTNAIVGQITDASELHIGAKGDLNGFIFGTNGTAKVQTIGAGGYNIQCFHFRTLVNKA